MEELMDLMVTGESPLEVSDKMKEILYAKSAERVDALKPVAASSLFGAEEIEDDFEDEIETESEEE
tara:strand:- start:232 stop:429 length:198 start_codon:yes stop_codon:yes gene_type:complete